MDSDNPTLKWSLAAVGVVVVCFCLGYFVFGSKGTSASEEPSPAPLTTPSPVPSSLPLTAVESSGLSLQDVTAEKEAERRRREEAEQKKREEAQRAAEAAAAEPTPAPEEEPIENLEAPTPSPEPDKTEKTEKTAENPEPDKPTPTPSPTPTPTPKPTTPPSAEPKPSGKSLYRVRVGGNFRSRDEAEKTSALLRGRGYAAVIKADLRGGKKVYHVQVGAYSDAKSAERTKAEMENNGFDASIH